jgi:oxygen-independent coproporphyrinogen-3 oxidase
MLSLLPPPSAVLSPQSVPVASVEGLYVHVPFCFHKCHYCDFYSITRQTPDRMRRYVELMLREAEQWAGRAIKPTTVFFGGGTPTLLPVEWMARLIQGLRQRIDLSSVTEWTVEANPATVTEDYCRMLRENGVDRLSFGAQSFNTDELKILERHHNPEDVHQSVSIARSAGFTRLNLDLIFAIPGQSLASWQRSLDEGISLNTPHLSCYALTFEPNTPIAVRRRLGQLANIEEDLELQMLHFTRDRLTGIGVRPYEISNFAIAGEECRHNVNYWTGGNYIGLGPSAASHVSGWRWKNRPHLGEWESAVQAGHLPATEVEMLSADRRAGELAMLMLRLESGITASVFREKTGFDAVEEYSDVLVPLVRENLVMIDGGAIRLTRAGINVADAIAEEFVR